VNTLQLLLDTSVIIAFCTECKRPYLFEKLTENHFDLFVPIGVANEIKQSDKSYSEFQKLLHKKTIVILEKLDENEIKTLNNKHPYLDRGENEVILQGLKAKKKNIQYNCVIDDRRARKVAQDYGLNLIGTIGLLENMHRGNIISSSELASIIHDLKSSGFWIK
jgi:predicted nucleic acid-binding protein